MGTRDPNRTSILVMAAVGTLLRILKRRMRTRLAVGSLDSWMGLEGTFRVINRARFTLLTKKSRIK
jgi:hypothetical protein